jgi:hypothetical protein
MTSNKSQKSDIRQRMSQTGEPYSVARHAVLAGAAAPEQDASPADQYLRDAEAAGVPADELVELRARFQAREFADQMRTAADVAREKADRAEAAADTAEEASCEAEDAASEAWDDDDDWHHDRHDGPRHGMSRGPRPPRPPRPPQLPRLPRLPRLPKLPRLPRLPDWPA